VWAPMVAGTPAAALGDSLAAGVGKLAVGAPADMIVFEARKYDELLSRPQTERVVIRSGRALCGTLPLYEELDALVSEPTAIRLGEHLKPVSRGAVVADTAVRSTGSQLYSEAAD